MSQIKDSFYYTEDHEWVQSEDELTAICGITDHAQEQLTDIVFVELPDIDTEVKKGDQIAVVESVKAASDVYSPVSGKIIKVNEALTDSPELINTSPYNKGWIFKIDIKDKNELDELMNADDYSSFVESGE